MYVISYCQMYSLNPSLSLDKIVIFRSFWQISDEIYDLSHFKKEHEPFFNQTVFYQQKDATDAVLTRLKATSLAELFSVELNFTVDTLNEWFSIIIKPKFLELGTIRKQVYRKENPIDRHKTICSICGFLLDVNDGVWIDFVEKCEYSFVFLRNIYSFYELKIMTIESEEKYSEIVHKVLEYYPVFEEALEDCDEYNEICEEVKDFLVDYLNDAYDDLKELKENIQCIEVSKKKDLILKKKIFLTNCLCSCTQTLLISVKLTK